jgi:hypothetical protein
MVRIRFPPGESPQTIGSAGDFTGTSRIVAASSYDVPPDQLAESPGVAHRKCEREHARDRATIASLSDRLPPWGKATYRRTRWLCLRACCAGRRLHSGYA